MLYAVIVIAVLVIFMVSGYEWWCFAQELHKRFDEVLTTTYGEHEKLREQLKRMEETLEEIRTQPEQEKLRQEFEKAHALTLKEVRLLKKGDTVGLIEAEYSDRAHPFRSFEYKHDHLDEVAGAFIDRPYNSALKAHRAYGFRHLDRDEIEKLAARGSVEEIRPHKEMQPQLSHFEELEQPASEWWPHDFIVGEDRSVTHNQEEVRCSYNFNRHDE